MNYLLYHRAARVSAPRLAAWMGITPITRTTEDRPRAVIRFGTSRGMRFRPSLTTINPRTSLGAYSTRGQQLTLLHQAGVLVPSFTTTPELLPLDRGQGILARDYPEGRQPTQGRGITVYANEDQRRRRGRQHDLYMSLIAKDRQFRVHVIGGRTRVREVVPDQPGLTEQAVWNLGRGFTYQLPRGAPSPRVVPAAVQAVSALRLDFGAVDVITTRDGIAYVLEVNTAPGLADPTLEWYGQNLGRLIGLDPTDMPQWEAVERTNDNMEHE